ncbi:MAG: hypothetical protein A2W73_11345 [Deltaproteobacteria bacterium RIFCSPLOWO2_12_55_13]|nr:MAG: hypothetical protein A2X89_06220 [Deltaproteobacteria bacterium GWD2_55_8]OGQ62848.1 MAG: hypothetical protein A2W73_11345 [Deltaproteobacteria bacterium RIFCSPLOWO2_12_55_13]OGQ96661.1 MAG: hypothetical protein A2253_09005 [Deltaproteobacteria bacterium RIFOXYA2_FULL_55_11]HBA38688.1 hypothetical protein [Deltaproteobacteria bacterium]
MESPNYEFTDSQNQTVSQLASRMKWVGIFFVALGLAFGLLGVAGLVATEGAVDLIVKPMILVMVAVIFFLSGIWTVNAARLFTLIVQTTGSDILNLMNALGTLRKLYYMQFWLIIISLVALLIAFAIFLVLGVL